MSVEISSCDVSPNHALATFKFQGCNLRDNTERATISPVKLIGRQHHARARHRPGSPRDPIPPIPTPVQLLEVLVLVLSVHAPGQNERDRHESEVNHQDDQDSARDDRVRVCIIREYLGTEYGTKSTPWL